MKKREDIAVGGEEIKKGRTIGNEGEHMEHTEHAEHPNLQETARSITPPKKLWVAVNDRNLRIGESHPRAVLTDHDVELMLELREEGFSYRWIAVKFEISLRQAYRICTGMQRSQIPTTRRRVLVRG